MPWRGSDVRPATVLILVFLLGGCARPPASPTPPASVGADLDWPAGPFSLTERSGKTVTDRDLLGSVWVASFVFTRCSGPCPAVTSTVARLQAELKDLPGVKFVTFTVDPARDDLSTLCDYANNRGADPERWLFLTGEETTIHKLLHDRFKQGVVRKTGDDVKPGDEFGHSTRLLLVDKNGIIRAAFDGLPNERMPELFEPDFASMKNRIRSLVRE